MHSAIMSRREARCTTANVGIGTKFTCKPLYFEETNAKLAAYLKANGWRSPLCRESRAARLYREIAAGRINGELKQNICRDYAKEFAEIERSSNGP